MSAWETLSLLEVVNDTAERGVRDIQEYANSARDKGKTGRIIPVSIAWIPEK